MDELTVDTLAEVLQETNRPLLTQVLRMLGPDRTSTVLIETLQCEAAGGMRTKDGTRRRTPGGTFFQLVRQQARPHERRRLFPRPAPQHSQGQPQALAVLTWDEVQTITQTQTTHPVGEARTMKLTLIGRPGKIDTRGQTVLFRMQGKPPGALPRGVPPVPTQAPMTWTVLVALRQWKRVRESLALNPEDQLIIEGYPAMQGSEHVLLAQSCVSLLQQRAQKQARQQPQAETTS